MKKLINVGLIFGGKSAEHDISIKSAEAIYNNIDGSKFTIRPIYINNHGKWSLIDGVDFINKNYSKDKGNHFLPWLNSNLIQNSEIDIYFPILHGPNGEDGKIQSLLELNGAPYVGANSLSSALAMDKVISKILLHNANLPTVAYLSFINNDPPRIHKEIESSFGYPVFIKPSSLGSSVGISKVNSRKSLKKSLDLAFSYDPKIIIEQGIDAREIEVSVIGNFDPKVSKPGELIPHNEFYDYNDKYINNKTSFNIPAELLSEIESTIQGLAKSAFQAHSINGMARIDFFLEKTSNQLFINEVNTIPGFTEISMFPKLWETEGISFMDLISQLINYGFEFHQHQCSFKNAVSSVEEK